MSLGSLPSSVLSMSCLIMCKLYVIKTEPEDSVNIQVFWTMSEDRRMDAKVI